ncbi:ankyrin repeat-containing domain protein [Colletotrichum phormii]|uniref:Ankyrin repeat-containing domain protein n=1 Tax=Colletotrichum phormii TaxID=359342 RepID=A0AAI9ZT00_9PEZI|nr:ankyrin repeat-containing domain protein [Colletotrichum phormii]KAK1636107.1 ankyrin repeat-containing domain protein [Colletotrichum phormii]
MLIEAHADITQPCTAEESTPLHQAVEFPQIVKILVDHGASINQEAADGQTPLSRAVVGNHKETVKLMLANPKNTADFSTEKVQNALTYAVDNDHVEIVAELLEAGADVNLVDDNGTPRIFSAMWLESPAMRRVILEHNPDLTKTDSKGNSILHHVNKFAPVESTRLAVNAGASLTAVNKFQSPSLSLAIQALCKEEVLQYLLSKDAILASLAKPLSGDALNPIHTACRSSLLPMVQMLLEKGADINMTSEGVVLGTPLISATLRFYQEDLDKAETVICYLLDKGADPELRAGLFSYPIISACLAGSSKIVKHILDRNVPLNIKDEFNRTPAHLACYNSCKILDLLQCYEQVKATNCGTKQKLR